MSNEPIESMIQYVEPLEWGLLKMTWRKEVMNMLNMLKYISVRPRGAFRLDKAGVWDARADRTRVRVGKAEREIVLDKAVTLGMFLLAAWIFTS